MVTLSFLAFPLDVATPSVDAAIAATKSSATTAYRLRTFIRPSSAPCSLFRPPSPCRGMPTGRHTLDQGDHRVEADPEDAGDHDRGPRRLEIEELARAQDLDAERLPRPTEVVT